jgi:hypothetical protein
MARTKREPVPIVYVRWFDSSITHGGTVTPGEAAGVCENESVGLLVREDEASITIALDRCIDTQGLRCTLCVPKVNVRSFKRLRA